MTRWTYAISLFAALAFESVLGASYAAPAGVKVGALTCDVSGGVEVVLTNRSLSCRYQDADGTTIEHYTGHISSFGANFGYTKDAKIVWAVFAPSSDFKAKALRGQYVGVTAGAAVGAGLEANVLVGGFEKSISLQPVSFTGSEGVNVAAGVTSITLTASD